MMLTRCPACQTVFRLRPEQLHARRGEVRCGHCFHPFNALEHALEPPANENPAPPPPAPDFFVLEDKPAPTLGGSSPASMLDFGIPEPPGAFDPIYDRRQHYIDVALTDPRLGGGRETAMRKVLADPDAWGRAATVDIPYSPSFQLYTDNGDNRMFFNRELQAAVYCVGGINHALPNPSCQGMVWFDEREFAMFKLNYKALAHLDGIARSIRQLATTLRAECPAHAAVH